MTAAAPPSRRRALLQADQPAPSSNSSSSKRYHCRIPLGPLGNARLPQPLQGRTVSAFLDPFVGAMGPSQPLPSPSPDVHGSPSSSASLSDYIPADKATALAAGAIAGITVGTIGGVGLTALVAFLVWRESKRRRLKKLSLGWSDDRGNPSRLGGGMGPWSARDAESQFLKGELDDNI